MVLVPTLADDFCGSSLLGPGALLSLPGWHSLLVLSPTPQGSQHKGPGCPSLFTPQMNLEGQDPSPSQLTSPGTPDFVSDFAGPEQELPGLKTAAVSVLPAVQTKAALGPCVCLMALA